MNIREGTRRLALLLGAVGAIFGGFVSYAELQSTMRQSANHLRFQQLANSDVVRRAKPDHLGYSIPPSGLVVKLPDATDRDSQGTRIAELDTGGVKTIHWSKDYTIASIETQDGQTFYPTPSPAPWSYLLIAIPPLVGFLIPWGTGRAIGWVVAGFAQPSR